MSIKDQKPLDEQEQGEILLFEAEDGTVEKYEFLDCVEYNGTDYAVLLPVNDDGSEPDSVYIYEIVEELDSDTDTYIGVADQDVVDAVYALFQEKNKDDFNFI